MKVRMIKEIDWLKLILASICGEMLLIGFFGSEFSLYSLFIIIFYLIFIFSFIWQSFTMTDKIYEFKEVFK